MNIPFIQSFSGEFAFHVTDSNLRIRADQLRTRLRLYPVIVFSQFLLEPLFVGLFWGRANHTQLLLWLTLAYSVHAIDFILWWRHRDQLQTVEHCMKWSRRFKIMTTLSGLMWGTAALAFFPPDLSFQALLICIALGLAAGAVTLDSAYPPAMYIYVMCVTTPLLARLLSSGHKTQIILGCMLALFLYSALSAGRELSKTFWQSLWQRHENDQLIAQLTEQKAIAETANREKSRFLASASHDLRQPLQALVLFSESLQDTARDDETRTLARQIGKSVDALVDMFNELLDISRLDAGVIKADIQHFRVQDVFDRLKSEFLPQAEAKELELIMQDIDLYAYSDPLLLERILRNLISNAIRYTDFGSVTVSCQQENGKLNFDVMDTGIGIRAKSLPHIFEEYYQVDNQHRDRLKGLGLGLAIVRRMEALLNCHVTVVSRPALGSVFSFALPAGEKPAMQTVMPAQPKRPDLQGITVALVDDNRDIRQMATRLLRQWGCKVHEGELPHDVLQPMASVGARPDILICDYRLPDGLTALDGIRELRELWDDDIPALVLTGDTAPQTLQEIQASGALLLHKPIAPARLRSIMYFALRENRNFDVSGSYPAYYSPPPP